MAAMAAGVVAVGYARLLQFRAEGATWISLEETCRE